MYMTDVLSTISVGFGLAPLKARVIIDEHGTATDVHEHATAQLQAGPGIGTAISGQANRRALTCSMPSATRLPCGWGRCLDLLQQEVEGVETSIDASMMHQ